jgi:DNA (cytosine-5)-methyltransferase 1
MPQKLQVLELFGGIGACSKALERLGIEFEIADYVEIDKYAVKSFNAIHGTNFIPQDITKWDKDIPVDLIMHGSPCQDFSIAGKQAGGDEGSGTRSSLLYETLRIVEKLKPTYVIWENVKNLLSKKHRHNFDAYLAAMEKLGYKNYYQVLNAKNYGIPQNRERVFTVSIREREREYEFPQPFPLERKLKDMLEDAVDERYFLSDAMMDYFMGVNQRPSKFPRKERFLQNINRKDQDRANSITTNPGNRPSDNFVVASQEQDENLKTKLCNELVQKGVVKGGEIINHSYTNSPQRATLDKYIESDDGVMPTITTRPDTLGYVEKVGQTDSHQKGGVYSSDGVSPTITATTYKQPTQIMVKANNNTGYDTAAEGDGIDIAYPNSTTRRGRVGHEVAKTITTGDSQGVVVDKSVKPSVAKNFEREKEQIATTDKEIYQCECENQWQDNKVGCKISPSLRANNNSTYGLTGNLRIRKLTPKECWRLMGFDDQDFEKAEKVNSNAQLYKQAGNSIVVDVLYYILRNLLK